ncbi:MAG: hypothetical protein ACR2G4_12835 [Pyrinomonadaceae bacterium]
MPTLEEIRHHPFTANNRRAFLVTLMCLERSITDPEVIKEYIYRAYTQPSKEFANKKKRTDKYIEKETRRSFAYFVKNGHLNQDATE